MSKIRKKISLFTYNLISIFIYAVLLIVFFLILKVYFTNRVRINDLFTSILKLRYDLAMLDKYQKVLFFERNQLIEDNFNFKKLIEYTDKLNEHINDLKQNPIIEKMKFADYIDEIDFVYKNYRASVENLQKYNFNIYDPHTGLIVQQASIKHSILNNNFYKTLGLTKYFKQLLKLEKQLYKTHSLDSFTIRVDKIENELRNLNFNNEVQQIAYYTFVDNFSKYKDLIITIFEKNVAIGYNYDSGIFGLLNNYLTKIESLLEVIYQQLEFKLLNYKRIHLIRNLSNLFFIVIILLLMAVFYYYQIKRPWAEYEKKLSDLAEGDLPDIEHITVNKEYYNTTFYFKELVENLKEKLSAIEQISKNNLDYEVKVKSDKDIIAKALKSLQQTIIKNYEETKKIIEEQKINQWLNQGLAEIGAIMRQNTDNLENFVEEVLKSLMDYTGALQGIFFILMEEEEKEPYLLMKKAYAYGKERTKQKIVKLYEGLIGTAAVEKRFYFFDKVPDNYVFLEDAFGKARPESLVIMPLVVEDKLLGVIEMAFAKVLDDIYKTFFKRISTEIAITLSYVKINQQTKDLFEHTRKQAQELADKEEQYRKNQEQLKQIILELEDKIAKQHKEIKALEELIDEKVAENKKLKDFYDKKMKELEDTIDKYIKQKEFLEERIKILEQELKNHKKQ